MKKAIKITIISIGVLILLGFIGLLVYRSYFSMGVVEAHTIGSDQSGKRYLLATQQSSFKDGVVDEVEKLINNEYQIDVVDITQLDKVVESDYSKMFILTTIQSGDIPNEVYEFIKTSEIPCKIIYTSHSGTWKEEKKLREDVDAVSSASTRGEVGNTSQLIVDFFEKNEYK